MIKNAKVVYLILATDGSLKIGVTKNPQQRFNTIRTASGKAFAKTYHTDFISNAEKIETMMKSYFKNKRIEGEWFSIPFDDALFVLQEKIKKYAKIEEDSGIDDKSLEEFADFATGKTQIINNFLMLQAGIASREQMREIETPICELSHQLSYQNCKGRPISIFKHFWGLAFQLYGINNVEQLTSLDFYDLRGLFIAECCISSIVKQGIFTGKHYKEIYKDCKARLETVSELAYLGAS